MNNHRITDKELKELKPQIDEWKKTYPDRITMISLQKDPVDVIVKIPDATLLQMSLDGDLPDYEKNRQLCLNCILYPELEDFNRIVAEKDTIVVPLARELVELGGTMQKTVTKKL